jgi:hypothetical protein
VCQDNGPNAAPEVECNGLDEDCDGSDAQPAGTCSTGLAGVCDAGTLACATDGSGVTCVPDVEPGAQSEVCDDGVDNDCDGASDCDDSACDLADNCQPPDVDECLDVLSACGSKYATCTDTEGGHECEYGPALVETVTPTRITIAGGDVIWLYGVRLGINAADVVSIQFGAGGMSCGSVAWASEEELRCTTRSGVPSHVGILPVLVTTLSHGGPGSSLADIEVIECEDADRDCQGLCFGGWIPDCCGECGGDGSSC